VNKYCPKCNHVVTSFVSGSSYPKATHACGWCGHPACLLKEPLPPTPTPKLKYVSIDIEATGLDYNTCQVLELGAVIEDWVSPVSSLPTFRFVVKHNQIVGEPFALALNANLLKLIANPPDELPIGPAYDLGWKFSAWLVSNNIDPRHVQAAGKNFASFDAQFLKRVSNFSAYVKFNHCTIDPCMLLWRLDDEGLPDTKTCMERAEIDGKVAHTAVEDAIAVVKMIRFWANNT